MKRALLTAVVLSLAAAGLCGGWRLWSRRPWRPAVIVNGRTLTAAELELRAVTLRDDEVKNMGVEIHPTRAAEAMADYRLKAAKMWIVKEVLLGEAVARGFTVSPEAERRAVAKSDERLRKSRKISMEEFFKTGPLPEETRRRDYREGLLVSEFMSSELNSKIKVTPKETDEKMDELKRMALAAVKPGERPPFRTDRKAAMDLLRAERFRVAFRDYFRASFVKADVKSPMFPQLEKVDGVSPPHDGENAPGPGRTKEAGR